MAKYLKDILKQAHDTIKGVRPSETGQLSIGKDPGVDYKPKAADEADFIAKHSVQKWDDVAGNPNFADKVSYSLDKEKNHGNTLAKAKATNEEVSDAAKKVLGAVAKKHGGKVPFTSTTYKDGKKVVTRGHNDEKGNRVVTSTTNEEFEIDEAMSPKQKQYSNRVKTMPGKKGAVMGATSNFEAPFHKVHATISKNGGAKETVKHEIKAKDKHDAIFDVQMMHHKAGHKVHDVKHKGMVKEETDPGFSESKKAEDVQCNSTPKGTECPVHGVTECMSASPLKELSTDLLHRAAHKAAKKAMWDPEGRGGKTFKKYAGMANKFRAKGMEQEKKEKAVKEETINEGIQTKRREDLHGKDSRLHHKELKASGHVSKGSDANYKNSEGTTHSYYHPKSNTMHAFRAKGGKINHAYEWSPNHSYAKAHGGTVKEEAIDEVLTKSTTAGETIHDFVHSDNPKFKGKSKEKRKEMALAAYYQKQRNEEVEIDEDGPVAPVPKHLDAHGIAKKYKDYVTGGGTPETASRYKSHVNMLSKKTGEHADDINKQVRKHVKSMNEAYAVEPLLGGDTAGHDEGVEMVKAELKALANKAMHLVMQMPDSMHVEPWCQAKIANAKSFVNDVHDYMIYGDHEKEKEDEGTTDTPLTLPNMSVDVNTGQNV
jgi:hypothetical protein